MRRFDLITEPWIPVQRAGRRELVSLREILVTAHEVDDLAPPRMTLVPAILRQALLSVLIDALGIPRSVDDWAERWRGGCFDSVAIDEYLERHRDRFDLFHPKHPFAQVGGLRTANGETKPSSLLIPSVASGNNVPLFSTRTEAQPPALSPPEAALWLLHTHCWDTAAIKTGAEGDPNVKQGKTTANPTGPLGQFEAVVPLGRNLFETLLLNTRIIEDDLPPSDQPHWRRDPPDASWEERAASGLLDLFTWQSRRIRLVPSEGPDGPVVREVIVCAGDRLIANPDMEPHAAWRRDPRAKEGQPERRPRRPQGGRHAWQGLDALLALQPPEDGKVEASVLMKQVGRVLGVLGDDYPLRALTTGVLYGNQSAVVEHMVEDLLPIPIASLRQDEGVWEILVGVVEQADALAKALNGLDADLRRACGGDPVPWDRGQRPEVELVQLLDPQVRRMLTGLQREPEREDEAAWAWEKTAHRTVMAVADRMLDQVPPSAFAGRKDEQRNHVYRPANAERWFRRQVARSLPRLFADTDREEAS